MNWIKNLFQILYRMIVNKLESEVEKIPYKVTMLDVLIELDMRNPIECKYNTIRMDSKLYSGLLNEMRYTDDYHVKNYTTSRVNVFLFSGRFDIILDNEVQGFEFTQERRW